MPEAVINLRQKIKVIPKGITKPLTDHQRQKALTYSPLFTYERARVLVDLGI